LTYSGVQVSGHLTWSPDGRHIAFASKKDGNAAIYVMDADGSNVNKLTNSVDNDYDPAWSPDGKSIAFVSDRDGTSQIYVMSADGNNQGRITNSSGWNRFPAWSPDGKSIAFSSDQPAE
jgi:TolB protein